MPKHFCIQYKKNALLEFFMQLGDNRQSVLHFNRREGYRADSRDIKKNEDKVQNQFDSNFEKQSKRTNISFRRRSCLNAVKWPLAFRQQSERLAYLREEVKLENSNLLLSKLGQLLIDLGLARGSC